jgi:hypothetical protein
VPTTNGLCGFLHCEGHRRGFHGAVQRTTAPDTRQETLTTGDRRQSASFTFVSAQTEGTPEVFKALAVNVTN